MSKAAQSLSIAAIIVAAGKGERAGGGLPKQYRSLAGTPLLRRSVERLVRHSGIGSVVVAIGEGQEALAAEALGGLDVSIVTGGATRRLSVLAGLEALMAQTPDLVLIHDAARPILPASVINRLVDALGKADGACPTLPVADTLAENGAEIGDAVPREGLARIQTPQAFRYAAILAAHRAWASDDEPTDDIQVARAAGLRCVSVAGDALLDKITHEEDFALAALRLGACTSVRTGMGFDVHRLAEAEELWLGGLLIPHDKGLAGHSDADVALHAITDALLGAIAAGDIGDHFPPSDPQWRGARSDQFLAHAVRLVRGRGGVIEHVDLTIICEAPKIGPHKIAMRERIADILGIPVDQVSVKATTTERLGYTGRGEGIAAQAVATITLPKEL